MASSSRAVAAMAARIPFAAPASRTTAGTTRALSTISRTARTTQLRAAARPSAALKLNQTGRLAFRRAYADEAPKPKPGKLRRTFRWVWRLTYLSFAGLLGYTGYVIYLDRHPAEQNERDPNKKTLVVLGESTQEPTCHGSELTS